jgi:hypothetical protein
MTHPLTHRQLPRVHVRQCIYATCTSRCVASRRDSRIKIFSLFPSHERACRLAFSCPQKKKRRNRESNSLFLSCARPRIKLQAIRSWLIFGICPDLRSISSDHVHVTRVHTYFLIFYSYYFYNKILYWAHKK